MEFKLVLKKINNTLSTEEEHIFNAWYKESKSHQIYFDNIVENWNKDDLTVDIEKGWERINQRIDKKPKMFHVLRYGAAAAIAVLLITSIYIGARSFSDADDTPTEQISVSPGVNKAVLELEDGTEVALGQDKTYSSDNLSSNGRMISYETGTKVKGNTRYNYLTVPRGGEFYVELSDNSRIWLNSASKIKYPVRFNVDETRTVELLYGEVYLEVSPSSKNNGTAFEVISQGQSIEVLGTQFNIRAYKDETEVTTTLIEGSIAVETKDSDFSEILKPNQQSVFNKSSHSLAISDVDVDDTVAWRQGFFNFSNEPLERIAKILERWYDVDIYIKNKNAAQLKFNGSLSKEQNIENILETINVDSVIQYHMEKNTIIIE